MIILGIDPGMAETGWGVIKKSKVPPALRLRRTGKSPASAKASADRQKLKVNSGLSLVDHGCIKTLVGQDMSQRLLVLRKELKKILLEHKPDCLAIEQLFFGRNSKTAMIVGQARGVIMVTAAEQKVSVFEYQGLSVKLNLSGSGRCPKKGIQSVVRKRLGLRSLPRPQHAADALALAIYHHEILSKKKK